MKPVTVINPALNAIAEDVMGFLNEVQQTYPNAISLASGRPDENYFDLENFAHYFDLFISHEATLQNCEKSEVIKKIGQYSAAKGIVNQLAAQFLEKDEEIKVSADDLVITVGTQEAIAITILTICDRENDVILVEDPCYIGVTHFSTIAGYHIQPVSVLNDGISLDRIEQSIRECRLSGKKVKVIYVIPDFQNPTGISMSVENRKRLLKMADEHDFFIIEDNAYGDFVYRGEKKPTLKSLDEHKRVIYLRSFSKSLYPSIRLSILVADQWLLNNGISVALSGLMAKTKGYLTVNTSSISQAIFAGTLLQNDCSLRAMNADKVLALKEKRDCILKMLRACLNDEWAKEISWNEPEGGFFLTVKLPFELTKMDVALCAEKYHVIFTPMSFFYFGEGGENEIRLAFSYLSIAEIEVAIESLAHFFKTKIQENKMSTQ